MEESWRRAASSPLLPTSTEIVESLSHKQSPGSTRFLCLFSPSNDSTAGGVELHEHEVLWTTSAANPSEASVQAPATGKNGSSSSSPFGSPSSRGGGSLRRGTPDRSFGILAALPEEEGNRSPGHGNGDRGGEVGPLLQRKTSISSLSSISSLPSSNSNSPSSASSLKTAARMIPALPKSKPPEYNPRGNQPQSAPVKVPLMPRNTRMAIQEALDEVGDFGFSDEDERLPPHEIVARSYAQSPMTTFSVLEGAGRTLKGRDLRQVRNAVLRQTGFLD